MFIFAHTSNYSQVSEERLPAWKRKIVENMINDNEIVIIDKELLREHKSLNSRVRTLAHENTQLRYQNKNLIKQYDDILNKLIYRLVIAMSLLFLFFFFLMKKYFDFSTDWSPYKEKLPFDK